MSYDMKEQRFISFQALLEELEIAGEDRECLDRFLAKHEEAEYKTLIEDGVPSWIFSFLEFLRNSLAGLESVDYYSKILNVYACVLRWLIEESDFLCELDAIRRNDVRMQGEQYLNECLAAREALQVIKLSDEQNYIRSTLNKLEKSGFLFRKNQRLITLSTIFRFSPRLARLSVRDLVRLVYHAKDEALLKNILDYFEHRIGAISWDEDYFYEEKTNEVLEGLKDLIWLFGAYLLLYKQEVTEEYKIIRARFFRYLYIVGKQSSDIVRSNAFNSLWFGQSKNVFTWNELLRFSVPDLIDAIIMNSSEVNPAGDDYYGFEGRGTLTIGKDLLILSPCGKVSKESEVFRVGNVSFLVQGKKRVGNSGDFAELVTAWKSLFSEYVEKTKKKAFQKQRPPVGAKVKIKIKGFLPSPKLLAFANIVDEEYTGDGALHVSNVTRARLDDLERVFHLGDVMKATVIDVTDERIQFSIKDELNALVGVRFKTGDCMDALLFYRTSDLYTWISEHGFCVFTNPRGDVEIGCYREVRIKELNEYGYAKAEVIGQASKEFDRHDAVCNLAYYHIENYKKYTGEEIEEGDPVEFEERECVQPLSFSFVNELVEVLYLFLTKKVSVPNLNLLYLLKLVAHVIGDHRRKDFFNVLVNYLSVLHDCIHDTRYRITDVTTLEEGFNKYPVLRQQGNVIRVLSSYMDKSRLEELLAFVASGDWYLSKVAKYVLSCNLLDGSPEVVNTVRDELLSFISFKTEEKEDEGIVMEFGDENGSREFKSSIVYPAESTGTANLDEQMDEILLSVCGFLNASGGVLYVGVNDFGVATGIENDYNFLRCNRDAYELYIRRRIVAAFGTDVNGLIVIKFKNYGNKVVCGISIPAYDRVVEYKNMVWQRQGNSTRSITGTDLRLIKKRKKESVGMAQVACMPPFAGEEGYEI